MYMVPVQIIFVIMATIHKISFLSSLLYMWMMDFTA
jgi:hypothetical protein